MPRDQFLTRLARAGFAELDVAGDRLRELSELSALGIDAAVDLAAAAADPDAAVDAVLGLLRRAETAVAPLLDDPATAARLFRLAGASVGLADFFRRHPEELTVVSEPADALPEASWMRTQLLEAVETCGEVAGMTGEPAWVRLRMRYRRILARIAAYDLEQPDPISGFEVVARALSDLAAAAIEASLAVARAELSGDGPGEFPEADVTATRLAVVAMGKTGAHELNYVSDVDVIFVTDDTDDPHTVPIATRLAVELMRGIESPALEPALWDVDSNLRPEGRNGALVRTLASHLAYYDRWAKTWEFQAMLKARPLAGDLELGERFVTALAPRVWGSSSEENFVASIQRMRERVTANIPDEEVHYQLKLGPGGLRDVEFTVQLLQLVHGQADEAIRQRGTLPALAALARHGYIGRAEAAEFAVDYRILRLLEHRLQLMHLRRTHLMPRDERELRVLARASGLAVGAAELTERWESVKGRVRGLHERLFYRPLLSAVAALDTDEFNLTSDQAAARLRAIGFQDPRGALGHIAALSGGVSRRATIQRHLLPVMLQWFADGADPDYGLLAFRRLSEDLGGTHWFLRMLRDSAGAAQRLTSILSGSRFAGELLAGIPEAAAWLDNDRDLAPRSREQLLREAQAIVSRHDDPDAAAASLRAARRREVLRLAFGSMLGTLTITDLGHALSDITEATVQGVLTAVREPARRDGGDGIEFAVIGMGRFGGGELGFGSDADVLFVFRPAGIQTQHAHQTAIRIASELTRLTEDPRLPLDLDTGLRPEGRSGPVVRSLDAYRAYYERWSLTWEAQALLRARAVGGDPKLQADFTAMADRIRYPETVTESQVREVKRIKARVESERLPQGADPRRHLKLGRGSLSDVEWLVQLEQLRHAAEEPRLRTTSTLEALEVAVEVGLVGSEDAGKLRAAWEFASRARSAMTLWTNKTADVLPVERHQLEGVARILEYPPGSASDVEEDYLAVTRRARAVFERLFYDAD